MSCQQPRSCFSPCNCVTFHREGTDPVPTLGNLHWQAGRLQYLMEACKSASPDSCLGCCLQSDAVWHNFAVMFTVSTIAKLMCGCGMLQIAFMETQLANRDTHTAEMKQKLADSGTPSAVRFLPVSFSTHDVLYCS